jgi:hypothetical protein
MPASQAGRRGFESRLPLHKNQALSVTASNLYMVLPSLLCSSLRGGTPRGMLTLGEPMHVRFGTIDRGIISSALLGSAQMRSQWLTRHFSLNANRLTKQHRQIRPVVVSYMICYSAIMGKWIPKALLSSSR